MTDRSNPHNPPAAVQDLTGTTVGRFVVRARLGAGGMGEVYRAEDTKLKRPVALKRVTPELATDPSYRSRFLREAERASSLAHEHIAAVYDVLEENGEIFLVMEYVEGQTLRERMREPFSEPEFFELAIQCAEALVAAQARAIVHRDIKPENIMVTRAGKVKILDFGVARRVRQKGSEGSTATSDSTSTGLSGTPAYMAPEVLLEQEADGRADIFSLGVVLYEALARRHPFRAESFMGTCDRILREAPTPITKVAPTVSTPVEAVLSRMMAKSPAERFASAQELAAELKRLQSGKGISFASVRPGALRRHPRAVAVAAVLLVLIVVALNPDVQRRVKGRLGLAVLPEAKNLAVLPFDVAGGDARSQAFCDGLVSTLTAKLTKLSERSFLQVVPASEVRSAKARSAQEARQGLGVNLVLVGSLHQSGDQVRVSYALVDTATLRQLQAETVTASLANPFELEDRIVQSVLGMLDLELRPAERSVFAAHGTDSESAYDLYLQGLGYLENYDRAENIDNAINVFEQALRLDTNYALAHTGLGQAYWRKYENTNDAEWVGLAQKSCERALGLDANLAAARVCLGTLLNGTGRHLEALEEWRRAVELEPTNDAAHRGLGFTYQQLRKPEEAEQTYKRAIALRPHYWGGHNWLAKFYFTQGRYEEAAAEFRRAVELAPDSFQGYSNVGAAYYALGRSAEAIAMFEKSISIRPTYFGYSNLATVYFQLRRFDEASRTYEQALQLDSSDYVLWGNLGDAYHFVPGKQIQASAAYRKAVELAEARLRVNERQIPVLADLANYYALLGEVSLARGYLRRALQLAPNDADARFKAALVHNTLGETDLALEWLEKALQAGYSASVIKESAFFDNLRNHRRYLELMRAHTSA